MNGMRFKNRVALVTGAAGSIAGAAALAFAREGARLVLVDREPCDEAVAAARALGAEAVALTGDVADPALAKRAIETALARFGRLDVLVPGAGITCIGPNETLAEAEWDRVIAVNLKGTWLWCQAAMAPMRRQRSGRIVTIGSIVAKHGGNARPWIDRAELEGAGNAAYAAAKAGVHALTMVLAKDLAADGVTVNCVAPGPVTTRMTKSFPEALKQLIPIGRMTAPEEVAAAILFLASDDAAAITGEILDVNGGLLVG